ncbi:unnamed protein product [Microthlaspi erraticum]|uniref:Endonuclease/exonuclease/phosphatase domain-containing protein n=1 Tax=Microthlaspi erraticum TaxID=1685480 RepID=A0A6D2HDU1_9BRAS|nr:unnamed protein product [Microthlaspi erraticum]
MFLMETKNQDDYVFPVFRNLGFDNHFSVPPEGSSGGLAIGWSSEVHLEVLSANKNFIDTKICFKSESSYIKICFIDRADVWDLVSTFGLSRDNAWLLTGDFNEIQDNSEKKGGPQRSEGTFIPFRSFISQNGLWNVPHSGNCFSWRGQRHSHFVHSHLDRALSNCTWSETFPSGHSHYLRFEESDHRPLCTTFDTTKRKGKGIFRFDRRLRKNPEMIPLIEEAWTTSSSSPIYVKSGECRRSIILWTREQNEIKTRLMKENQEALDLALSALIPDLTLIGDKNTGFFHADTRGRRAQNNLTVLEDDTGVAHHDDSLIGKAISDYYQLLFTSEVRPSSTIVEEALQARITPQMNTTLTRIPYDAEIKAAVFAIHPDKAPGPDGFSAGFYHTFWDIICPDVYRDIRSFFTQQSLHTRYNETHIRLIPKSPTAKKVADFRPIALYSIHYKIIAKLLTKRLQPLLRSLISKHQSALSRSVR